MSEASRAPDADISIVYVEDDERLACLTMQFLALNRISTTLVSHGDEVLAEVMRLRPDLVLLNIALPGVDGFAACRALREHTDVPIIMLTAMMDEFECARALDSGADDYMTKPYSARELLARVRAQVRRARGQTGPLRSCIQVGELVVDASKMKATLGGQHLSVTGSEFVLLRALAERAGRAVSREQLLFLVQGSADDSFDRSIDVYISRLRQKLGDDARQPRLVKTVRGIGYMLAAAGE